jgi:hypothetical protein
MGVSAKLEQKERLAVLKNEQAQHEPSTYHALANLNVDTGVTPSRVGKSDFVSGSEEGSHQPSIPSGPWSSDYARLPDEMPLGIAIDAQEPNGTPVEVAASIAALSATAPAPLNVVAGTVGGAPSASPPDVGAPPAFSSSGASASEALKGDGADRLASTALGSASSPTLSHSRLRRKL